MMLIPATASMNGTIMTKQSAVNSAPRSEKFPCWNKVRTIGSGMMNSSAAAGIKTTAAIRAASTNVRSKPAQSPAATALEMGGSMALPTATAITPCAKSTTRLAYQY